MRVANGGWNRRVWRLAGPIIVSNVTVPLLGAVDTAVVGHLPDVAYLGAVAVGALVFSFLYSGLGFLRMGTTGLTAQALGADDADELRAGLVRALALAAALAGLLLLLRTPMIALALTLIDAGDAVETHARAYYAIRIFSAPAALGNFVVLGWFLGLQNARAGLYLQLLINGLNIILDLVFVIGLGMAVEGVALATVIAEYAGLIAGLVMIRAALGRLDGRLRWGRVLDGPRIRHAFGVNRDIFLRTLSLVLGFAYFTAASARLGDVVLAANAVLMNLVTFMAYGLDGFAFAAEALVGRAVGAGDRPAFAAVVRATTLWAGLTAVAFTLAYLVAGPALVALMTTIEAVRTAADAVIAWPILAPLVAVWSYQLDGIFLGATRTREMRNAMIVSLALYLAVAEAVAPPWGNHGLWFALMVFMIARAATLMLYYPRLARDVGMAGRAG